MVTRRDQKIVAHILRALITNKVPLHKIVLHKFAYFLETQGINTGLRFQPAQYGPYSHELSEVLDDLEFWEYIDLVRHTYKINNLDEFTDEHDESITLDRLDELASAFSVIAKNSYDFKNMELIGTVLYCARTLKFINVDIDDDAIIRDFQGWKEDKYTKQEIKTTIDNLRPYLPQ